MTKFKSGSQFISYITGVKFTKKEIYNCPESEKDLVLQKWQTVDKAVVLKNLTKVCKKLHVNVLSQLMAYRMQNKQYINENAYEVGKMVKVLLQNFDNQEVDTYDNECIYSYGLQALCL